MSDQNPANETKTVVVRVMKTVNTFNDIGKPEFETILSEVMQEVENNSDFQPEEILSCTDKVLEAMPTEYGQLSQAERTWEAMIAWLYNKYLKVLRAEDH